MNNKDKQKSKNSKEVKNSSLDEDISNYKEFLIDIEEDPNSIIEKLLIKMFNQLITNKNEVEEDFIIFYKKKIKELCQKHPKKHIILFLFSNISKIIQRYRLILSDIPKIMNPRNYLLKNEPRSSSYNEKYSKKYIYFAIKHKKEKSYASSKKVGIFDYNLVMKNFLNKLLWIKNYLKKGVSIIENIFEYPLSDFKSISVEEGIKEYFLRIILHDDFIWNKINKNKRGEFKSLIAEILEDFNLDNFQVNILENKIEYFNKSTKKCLKIQNIQSSLETRAPEEAIKINTIYYDDEHERLFQEEKESDKEINNIAPDKNNNLGNINMIKFSPNDFINNNFDINKALFTNETLNEISKINNLNNINNINKENLNLEKNFSFPGKTVKVPSHTHINLNNILSQKSDKSDNDSNSNNKFNKKRFHKQIENNVLKNKKVEEIKIKKEEKNEIPNDLDDLVKYIKDDNTQNKKKKKNRKKTKKRNKNNPPEEGGENKKEQNEIKEKDDDNFIDDEKDIQMFKEDISRNSINRFEIHKIKFKYRPKYLKKISKLEN